MAQIPTNQHTLLDELDDRQESVLDQLDELNRQIESLLSQCACSPADAPSAGSLEADPAITGPAPEQRAAILAELSSAGPVLVTGDMSVGLN